MMISVLQENLAKGVNIVQKAIDARPAIHVLENILLEAEDSRLKLVATNLQLSITMWIGAKVEKPGAITLPAKTLADLVNKLSRERVDLTLDNSTHTVTVRCGTTISQIKGIDADEFPPITHSDDSGIIVSGRMLKEMIAQTSFAAARQDTRPILTGVYTLIDKDLLTMAAADGYRLAVRTGKLDTPYSGRVEMVIPARALNEVARVLGDDDEEVSVSLPDRRDVVTFHLPNVDVSSQLLEGRFPDFTTIIPRGYVTQSVMYTEDLLKKCQTAEIFARDSANSGRLYVKPPTAPGEPGEVIITGKSQERGSADNRLDAHVEGEPLDIRFNIRYLIEVLGVIKEERVVFQSNGAENPGVLRPENREDFVHVIMPMSQ
ncbi:MAG: DNA polymerase III subunit beta [Anaerolineae bacterium]|jgi:DNA polymerase-3 subunit beta|nr:DNA polymerase III subunit beta [Anaerolineae bacterium]